MAEAFIQPVTEIVCCLYAPIARHVNYARKLSSNVQDFYDKAKDLSSRRDDIINTIDRWKPQKTATKECENWIAKVRDMEGRVQTINNELNAPKKCLGGLCPDVFTRIKCGKSVVNTIGEVKELLEKFKPGGDEFLTDASPRRFVKRPDPDSKLTTSADKMLEEVLNNIIDKRILKIGIWGMGGVGKTTVLHLLNKSPEISSMFDFVIWVTVSKSWNIRKLQDAIWTRLNMGKTNDLSDETVANNLFEKLEGKKYLLLLDDVWEKVDLSSIGLPNATEDNGCKVVLTTRNQGVCRKMNTNIDIKVRSLSEDEAREMFYSNVGDVVESLEIRQLAEEIVRKCGGLPLALKVVSGALRKVENVNVWKKFLRDLKSPATFFIKEMDEEVFKPLKVSYDHLEGPYNQCLLYCGLYPEDYEIRKSELIDYWRAEGLLSHEFSLEEAWVEGHVKLQALIDSSLLELCEGRDDYVKLHDVVRDLVLAMTSRNGSEECKHLVRAGFISTKEKMPEDEEWTKATRISFIENEFCNLPDSPHCPLLLTLLLQHNYGLKEIPESFYINMPKLHVLDLSDTKIESLPASISNLVSLRALFLRNCYNLKVLPETISAAPKGLEMLEIIGGFISQVPLWISELTALKCLKLLTWVEMTVPSEVICSLSRMEVFACSKLTDESEEIVVKELSNLTAVSSLEFEFSRVGNLEHFLQSSESWREGRLSTFYFSVGNRSYPAQLYRELDKDDKIIKYAVGKEEGNGKLPWAIEKVICRSNCFELMDHGKINTLSDLGAQNTCNLKECFVYSCNGLENVIDRNGLEMNAFPKLESLRLFNLVNLRYILFLELEGHSPPPPPSVNIFTNLKKLELFGCPRIKMVFSSGFMIQLLSNLEYLSIGECDELVGMISKDEKVDYEGALPKLKKLLLFTLPEFVSFFEDVPMRFSSLKVVRIRECPKLRNPPFNLRADMKIEVKQKWWDELEWDNNTIKSQFHPTFIDPY